jgi:hypothetical protein
MHKGFPEMLTYLLRKPMEYCSHTFVYVSIMPFVWDASIMVQSRFTAPRECEGQQRKDSALELPIEAKIRVSDYFQASVIGTFLALFFHVSVCC